MPALRVTNAASHPLKPAPITTQNVNSRKVRMHYAFWGMPMRR